MAQALTPETPSKTPAKFRFASNATVSVATSGNTTLLTLPVSAMERLFVQVSVATNNLDAFVIQGKAHPDATAVTLYSAAGDYTSPVGLLLGTSGDLTAIAAAGSGWFLMDVRGLYEVTVLASATGGAASVTAYAGAQ